MHTPPERAIRPSRRCFLSSDSLTEPAVGARANPKPWSSRTGRANVQYVHEMTRNAVKLLIFDPDYQLLLLRAADPASNRWGWYPVGGRIEPGEAIAAAARREAEEETGLKSMRLGEEVWRRRHTYRWLGRTRDVYERWFIVRTQHYTPTFDGLSEDERRSVTGARW